MGKNMINDIVPIANFKADGQTTVFPYKFLVLNASDLKVHVNLVEIQTTEYTVTGIGSNTGGNVTMKTAPAAGLAVMISRESPFVRNIEYTDNGDLLASELNADFDAVWLAMQETKASNQSAITRPAAGGDWDAQNRKLSNLADGETDHDGATVGQVRTLNGGAFTSAANAKTSETNARTSETNAATSAGQSSASAGQAAASAVAADTSAKNAASSETTAAGDASRAAASALAAAGSAATAAGSATTSGQQADRAKAEADRAQTANPDNQLKKAQNLADVADKTAARRNLDVDMIKTDSNQVNISSPNGTQVFQLRDDGWWAVSSWNGTGYENAPLPISSGGTGAPDAAGARVNLQVGPDNDVEFTSLTLSVNADQPVAASRGLISTIKSLAGVVRAKSRVYVDKRADGLTQHTTAITTSSGGEIYLSVGEDGRWRLPNNRFILGRDSDGDTQYVGGHTSAGALDWYVGKDSAGTGITFAKNNGASVTLSDLDMMVRGVLIPDKPTPSAVSNAFPGAKVRVQSTDAAQGTASFAPYYVGWGNTSGLGYTSSTSFGMFFTGAASFANPAISAARTDNNSTGILYIFAKDTQDITVGAYDGNAANSFIFSKNPTCDERLKRNIKKVSGQQALDNIERMEPATYIFKSDERNRVRRGFIAQEMEKIDPEYVKRITATNTETQETSETLTLDGNVLLLDALAAIKVLSERLKELEGKAAAAQVIDEETA